MKTAWKEIMFEADGLEFDNHLHRTIFSQSAEVRIKFGLYYYDAAFGKMGINTTALPIYHYQFTSSTWFTLKPGTQTMI